MSEVGHQLLIIAIQYQSYIKIIEYGNNTYQILL